MPSLSIVVPVFCARITSDRFWAHVVAGGQAAVVFESVIEARPLEMTAQTTTTV